MQRYAMLALSLLITLTGCSNPSSDSQPDVSTAVADEATPRPERRSDAPSTRDTDDPARFIPSGSDAIDTVRGDLTGKGTEDAVLVTSPGTTPDVPLGEGPARTVILLTRDTAGRLHKAAENSRIVPCARCGGLAGDPYAYTRIDAGLLTIAISGGSRERWFDDYTFRYSAREAAWYLERVVRGVSDTQSDRQAQIELTAEDFGVVSFADFDPATLPADASLK